MIRTYLILFALTVLASCIEQEGVSVSQECGDADSCKQAIVDPSTAYCVKNRLADRYDELDGNGTPGSPYIICTPAQFVDLGKRDSGWSKSFLLAQDIDLQKYYDDGGAYFQIGSCGQTTCQDFGPGHTQYTGTFDGAGYSIDGFEFSIETTEAGAAMFGSIGSSGVVANIVIGGAVVEGNDAMGVIAGRNDGVISNVKVNDSEVQIKASNTTPENVGGAVGLNRGVMRFVEVQHTDPTIINDDAVTFTHVGGVVGLNELDAFIGDVVNNSPITLKTANDVGGIIGLNRGILTLSKNSKQMIITVGDGVGGLVGEMSHFGQVSKCYNTALISAGATNLGGLVGEISFPSYGDLQATELESRGLVINSYNVGDVAGATDKDNVGGIVGNNRGYIQTSYFKGNVTGDSYVGGIAGKNDYILSQNFVHAVRIKGEISTVAGCIFGGSSAAAANFVATNEEKANGINPKPIFQQTTETLDSAVYPFNVLTDCDNATGGNGKHDHGGVEGNGIADYFNLSFELFSDSYLVTCPNPLPPNTDCNPTTQNIIHWDFSGVWKRRSGNTPDLGF